MKKELSMAVMATILLYQLFTGGTSAFLAKLAEITAGALSTQIQQEMILIPEGGWNGVSD